MDLRMRVVLSSIIIPLTTCAYGLLIVLVTILIIAFGLKFLNQVLVALIVLVTVIFMLISWYKLTKLIRNRALENT